MRDDISVSHQTGTVDGAPIYQTVINDHKGNRAWSGQSNISQDQASTEATRKFIGDRRAREYIGEHDAGLAGLSSGMSTMRHPA